MDDEGLWCQPEDGSGASCARCCGIYNYRGHDRELVTRVLTRQTELLSGWDGSARELARIGAAARAQQPPARFAVIANCPFAGFLGPERTRVGCLIHPRRLGAERRDASPYGAATCGSARCSAHDRLRRAEAEALAAAAGGDWYRYGLALNDLDVIEDFLALAARLLGEPVTLAGVAVRPRALAALGNFLRLGEDWPLARDPERLGKVYAVDARFYEWTYAIDYERLGVARPFAHRMIVGLGSVIETRSELEGAVELIEERVEELARGWIVDGGAHKI
jgi:hypothetical protein